VSPGDGPLEFDEAQLRRRLDGLSLSGRLLFVASCAERAAPTCLRHADAAETPSDVELVKTAVERSWSLPLRPSAATKDRSSADRLWRLASIENDWNRPFTRYVPDCASALYFAVDFQITRAIESASEAARWIYNAVDALAMNRAGVTSGGESERRRLAADRSVQRELQKQQRDLEAIEGARLVDPALVERLRADSARLGKAMADDFEAESAQRLRRGPPPPLGR
jgi:hypothetical protein